MAACRLLVPAGILAGHALIAAASAWASSLVGLPCRLVLPLAPLGVCLVVLALLVSWEAVRLVGGAGPFFCGGHMVVRDLLGLARARPPGRLVTTGPYSAARHPVYTSSLLAYTGLSLALPCLAPGLLLVASWVLAAAWAEDRVNMRSPEYRGYASRVPGVAPLRLLSWALARYCRLGRPGMV